MPTPASQIRRRQTRTGNLIPGYHAAAMLRSLGGPIARRKTAVHSSSPPAVATASPTNQRQEATCAAISPVRKNKTAQSVPDQKQQHRLRTRRTSPGCFGLLLPLALLVWGVGVVPFISWAHEQLASAQYGTTPTDHLNAVVGHQDSSMHPTHFIATNMNGQIAVSELPRGSAQHVTVYVIFQQLAASPGCCDARDS
jgi:hypothetical protein